MTPVYVRDQIVQLMKRAGLDQRALIAKAGLPPSASTWLSNLLNLKLAKWDLFRLAAIARGLDVSLDRLSVHC